VSGVTVTGTFTDPAGSPQRGFVTFTPSAPLADITDSAVIAPVARRYELTGGTFTSDPLAATDSTFLLPEHWVYTVQVCVQGADPYEFSCYIPSSPDPVDISALSPLQQVPQMAEFLRLTGGQLTGPLYASESPVQASEVATKSYVDNSVASLAAKAPVQEATAAALPANTATAQTLTADFTGALTVDGIAVSPGDRVLVKDEVTAAGNGIYVATDPGSSVTPWVLTRSGDMNVPADVPGAYAYVEQGTASAGGGFIVAGTGPYTLGVTAITWTQITGLGEITAGAGLSASGSTISLSVPVSVADGGTGSTSQNFADLSTTQNIGGTKTFTGEVIVPSPVNASDAATKAYADAIAQGLAVKPAVTEATTAALPAYTATSSTLTATSTGVLTVDGVAVSLNDRVLVKDETSGNAPDNGIYSCTTAGAVGVAYVLTRAADMDAGSEVPGAFTFVQMGSVNIGAGFVCTTTGTVTLGTTPITFTQFSNAGAITAGTGLALSGTTLSLTTPVTVAHGGTGAITAPLALAALGGVAIGGDLGGTSASPQVTGTHLSAALPRTQGGTGLAIPAPSGDVTGATDSAAWAAFLSAVPAFTDIWTSGGDHYYLNAGLAVSKALSFRGGATFQQVTSNTPGFVVTAGGFVLDGPALTGPQYAAYHSAESAVKVTGPSAGSPISFVRIRHASISSWGAYGVYAQYANDVVVCDNDIYNIQYTGCVYLSVTKGQVAENRIDNVVGSASNSTDCYGISLSEAILGIGSIDPVCQDITITGNVVTNIPVWTGIDMHAGTNVTISGNIIQNCALAISVSGQHDTASTPVTAPKRVKVTGNVIDIGALGNGQGTYGIVIQGSGVTTGFPADLATGISVTGNEVRGYGIPSETTVTLGGITAFITQGLSISGNTVYGCGPAGICMYHDNYGFVIGPNTIIDTWDTHGHAGAVWLASSFNTGTIAPQTVCKPATVKAQATIDPSSVGQSVSSVTTLTVQGNVRQTSPASVFASSGTVTVPTSAGTAVLAYTGTAATTLTGVTLSSGSGTISAGFATQTPANINLYGLFNNASTSEVMYYRGHCEATTEISDATAAVLVPNMPVSYPTHAGGYTVTVPWGAAWLDATVIGAGGGGGGGGSAASSAGVSAQAGGGGGGAGAFSQRGFAITSAMWGATLTLAVPGGGAVGAGGATGVSGNAGANGTAGSQSSISGSGGASTVALLAAGGGGGTGAGANSTAAVAGGNYAAAPGTTTTVSSPGQGGASASAGVSSNGPAAAGAGGGGAATASHGGGGGGAGQFGKGGAAGASGTSGTTTGTSGPNAGLTGSGGPGGGGGAPGGAGGSGGSGGPGLIILTWR
jgi:hypothetical protein